MLRRRFVVGLTGAGLALSQAEALAQAAFSTAPIAPQNPLEADFVAAFDSEAMRPVFRARFLESQVALAMESAAPDASPLKRPVRGAPSALIYTSPARLANVLGESAAYQEMTGREALERLRGGPAAINFGLAPMLTLEAEDVDRFLLIPG